MMGSDALGGGGAGRETAGWHDDNDGGGAQVPGPSSAVPHLPVKRKRAAEPRGQWVVVKIA
ncbi:hypothetical protein ABTM87_19770, partial [Acinetobacter baumannii]